MLMDFSSIAKQVLSGEAKSLRRLCERFDCEAFSRVAELIFQHKGKVIFSGIGKSGYIAQKLSSTFNSTGTRAVFLHPAEALHGDLGIYSPSDPTIMLSRSGSTRELLDLLPFIKQFQSPVIAMVGNLSSPLAEAADYVLDASVAKEADPMGFVPTSSTTVALALGDALACALMQARGFKHEDFLRFHPGGQLGKNLSRTVGDCARPLKQVACLKPDSSLREVVIAMTEKPLGAAFVMAGGKLVGLICEGDIRRSLQSEKSLEELTASDMMTRQPITVFKDIKLEEALQLMEDRPHPLNVLPVLKQDGSLYGLFRLHDAYRR